MEKSLMERFLTTYFSIKHKLSAEETEEEIRKLKEKGPVESPPPVTVRTRHTDSANGRMFYVNEKTSSKYTVFYIHGGGYEHDFSQFHWLFIRKIVERTDALVIAPAYILIPFGTYRQAFDLIMPVYNDYTKQHPEKKIILMGDSAGGGLALALAEQIKMEGGRIPDELILLSPWADIAMENPEMKEYEPKDPWLSRPWLSVCARYWADDLDLHDYRVSPMFGDLKGLSHVTVTVGTHELFYPDITKLYGMLDQDASNELITGQEMIHVYPLVPMPEAKEADEKIITAILR